MNKTSAIGIFDSGIGGLTVGHKIAKLMPNERIVYFGDTKHLPYGDKSPNSIVRFSKDISSFLLNQKCGIHISRIRCKVPFLDSIPLVGVHNAQKP